MSMGLPPTVARVAYEGGERFGGRPAQLVRRAGRWEEISFTELRAGVDELARGLVHLGVEVGDRVGVLAQTRTEWLQVQLAVAAVGAVVVPIYPTSGQQECEWILGDSGAVAVICENADQAGKIARVRNSLPMLRDIVVMDADGVHPSLETLRKRGHDGDGTEVERRSAASDPDDPVVIVYTSGTTGRPKGCVLTNRNLMSTCAAALRKDLVRPDDLVYLFLPMAHVFAQLTHLTVTAVGGTVAYCSAGATAIMSDLAEVRPTAFPSVPRIFEKIYAKVTSAVPSEALAKMVQAAEQGDEQMFAEVRALFGGRMRICLSGAAPIAPEILRFFHAAGVPVYESYGLSESAAVGTVNTPGATRIGTVGRPIQGKMRVASDGELLMKGPQVFTGYWKQPDTTADALVDGWLHTGDLGEIDADGFVRITGRKKDLIITANGKNLAPGATENELRQSPWISHAVMCGDRRPYPVALITLDAEQSTSWALERGLSADLDELCTHPEVAAHVREAVDKVNARYAPHQQIKRFRILGRDFSTETGELTPTLKVKRGVVYEKFAHEIDRLYADTPDNG